MQENTKRQQHLLALRVRFAQQAHILLVSLKPVPDVMTANTKTRVALRLCNASSVHLVKSLSIKPLIAICAS